MSSFESWGGSSNPSSSDKHPLKRVEPAVRKFIIVLRIDLDRLQKHKQNIVKLEALGEYDALDKEQVNASRTIQQLKANIRQLESTRAQVRDEDLEKFDAKVRTLQTDATVAVTDFLNAHGSGSQSPLRELSSNRIGPGHPKSFGYDPEGEEQESNVDGVDGEQTQLVVDPHLPSQESWNRLHEDLEDLNGIIHEFASIVDNQQEKVDEIEKNVEEAAENVHEGTKNIIMANKWKAAAFPVAGAVIGGLVGGPIGLVAGLKLGGVAAVGGGIAGFTGGTFLKRKQEKITSTELQNLKDSRSKSVPEHLSTAASDEAASSTEKQRPEETKAKNGLVQEKVETVGAVRNETVTQSGTQADNSMRNNDDELDLIQVENT